MCGILGGTIKEWDYKKGIEAIRHRGPDCQRIVEYETCILGFARLSIMDLNDRAMQPFISSDGMVIVLFNGEIYGFQELRINLQRKYKFRTTSDTEVIMYAYLEYGDKFIELVDGMYAIVIYDRRIGQFKLYRDRYGIKPLYYMYKKEGFAFASELKAITAACGDKTFLKIDNTAIYDYLAYQYIPEPKSLYQDIYKLEPATVLFYDLEANKIIKKEKYWKLHVNTCAHGKRKRSDILEHIRHLIAQSVRRQMVADVPVGTFLSGGVDSSIISYECKKIKENVKSFSIGFNEKDFDESRYAEKVSKHCGINNSIKKISAYDIRNVKGMLQSLYDEPFADTSAYPSYLLSQFAQKEVKVVLTGDGGDELFGGYSRYAVYLNKRMYRWINNVKTEDALSKLFSYSSELKKIMLNAFPSDLTIYANLVGIFDESRYAVWKKILEIGDGYDIKWHLRKFYHNDLPPMTRMRYLDFKTYLPGDILTKVDRTSMSVSLETRIPFLDRELVEYVFSLAEDECYYEGELKTLLKKAYEEILPHEILYRKKKGFSVPNSYIEQGADTKFVTILKREWKDVVANVKKDR